MRTTDRSAHVHATAPETVRGGTTGQHERVPPVSARPHVEPDDEVTPFSYGTLQQPEVQDAVLGRRVDGWADHLDGYRLDWITITDPEVVRLSGSDTHPVLVVDPAGSVDGTAWNLRGSDVAATDGYEVDEYGRVSVRLRSGAQRGSTPWEATSRAAIGSCAGARSSERPSALVELGDERDDDG